MADLETPDFYAVGRFVDSKDTANAWLVAKVIEQNPTTKQFRIRYEGWSEKWDTYHFKNTQRLAPFRRHSRLYTGQQKFAIRDWVFSAEEIEDTIQQLKTLSEGATMEAYDLTQFLRGFVFTLVDSLLVNNTRLKKEIDSAYRLFTAVIEFVVWWLNKADTLFPQYYANCSNPELYLTDSTVALACAWPELIFTIARLFGKDERTSIFHRTQQFVPSDYEPSTLTKSPSSCSIKATSFLLNYFAKVGGFQALIKVLREERDECKVPIEFLALLQIPDPNQYLNKPLAKELTEALMFSVDSRLSRLTAKEIKDMDREQASKMFYNVSTLVSGQSLDFNPHKFIEEGELSLSLKFFLCPYLEKRIRGLNDIKDMVERAKPGKVSGVVRLTRYLNGSSLSEWILQSRLIETIFGGNPHIELVKRASDLLVLLAENKRLTTDHLTMIWNSTQGKHDSLVRVVYQVVLDLAPRLTREQNSLMFNLLKSVPLALYDEKYLKLVKDFTASAIETQNLSATYNVNIEKEWYGLPLLFDALKDNSPLPVIELATDYLVDVLLKPACKNVHWKYASLCLGNVTESHSVPQSYKVFMAIVDIYPAIKMSSASMSKGEFLNSIEEDFGSLVKLHIREFQNYFDSIRTVAREFEKPYNAVLSGKHTHRQQIAGRLKFLEYLLVNLKGQFRFDINDFTEYWNLLIENSVTPSDSKAFLRWLYKGRDQKLMYSGRLLNEIFNEFLVSETRLPADSISMPGFKCFERHFLAANVNVRKLELKGNFLKARVDSQLLGYAKLLEIAMTAREEVVAKEAIRLIVSLHKRLSSGLDKPAVWNDLVSDCLRFLAVNDDLVIGRALRLMLSLIDEGVEGVELQPNTVLYISSLTDREHIKLHVNLQDTFGSLRKKIAEKYKKPLACVRVGISGIKYDESDDDLRLNSFRAFNTCLVDFLPEASVASEFDGVNLLAESQPLMDSLFDLLSRPKKSFSEDAWSLLTQLPMNPKIKSAILNFELSVPEILDTASIHHLLYCLLIVGDLLKENLDWIKKFSAKDGIAQLISVYLQTECSDSIGSSMACKYYSSIMLLLDAVLIFSSHTEDSLVSKKTLDVLAWLSGLWQAGVQVDEEEAAAVLRNARKLLISTAEQSSAVFIEFPDWPVIVKGGLIECSSERLSFAVADVLYTLSCQVAALNSLLLSLLYFKLSEALASVHSEAYFVITSKLSQFWSPETPELDSHISELVLFISGHPGEKSSKETDAVLKGVLKLLTTLAKSRPEALSDEFLELILHSCLFEAPGMCVSVAAPPKCKSTDTRKEALELVLLCCKSSTTLLESTMKYLQHLLEDPTWRTGRLADWNYAPNTLEKSTTGFVGMKNLGCTCYMNSTLQQLFMIPSFREGVITAPLTSTEDPAENLMYQLQYIFTALERSEKQSINPKGFTKAYKDWEGNPINPVEQMDAYEFFITFLDKVENFLKGTEQHQLVQDHFGGMQTTEIIGQDNCSHTSERNEPYLTLNVEVKNKKTLQESLESFVEGELLEGDNAYECERCEGKVSALRRVCIKQLPNVLIVVMRRFAFDFDNMARLKLNDYCEFPIELDMEPYTQEGLRRRDREKKGEEPEPCKFPKEYYAYRLKGIVVHMGTADSGHYYSFIQDRNSDRWIEFNDKIVKDFDPEDIPSEAYGGEERWSWGTTTATSMREKFRNAYMLVYERITFFDPKVPDDEGSLQLLVRQKTVRTDDCHSLAVREDNERLWRCKSSFSSEYLDFIYHFVQLDNPRMPKFLLSFMLTTLFRAKEKPKLAAFVKKAKELLQEDAELSSWLLEVVTVDPVLKELLLDCPVSEIRALTVGLATTAAKRVGGEEVDLAFRRLINNLHLAKSPESRCFSHFFLLINNLLDSNLNLAAEVKLFDRLISHVTGQVLKPSKYPAPFKYLDIHLGYDKVSAGSARQERFFLEDSGSSLAYLLDILLKLVPVISSEKAEVLQKSDVLGKMCFEATTKKGAKSLGSIYAYLSSDRPELANVLITLVFNSVIDYDSPWAVMFMRQLKPLITIQSPSYSERLNFLMMEYVRAAKASQKYYHTMIECINWLIKNTPLYPAIREWVLANPTEVRWLESYLSQHMYPPPTTTVATSTRVAAAVQTPPKSNAGKLDLLKRVLRGLVSYDNSEEYDSDEDLSGYEITPGTKLDIKDTTGSYWRTVTVLETTGELLFLKYDSLSDKYNKWVEKSSDYICPGGTKTKLN